MGDPRDLFDLAGRIAVVTGASSGLGRRAATVLRRAGAKVVGVARREEALVAWQAEMGHGTAFVAADITDREAVPGIVQAAGSYFGSPDIVIHAAGLNMRQVADDVTPEGWDATMAINLSAPFFLSQAFVPAMKERAGEDL